MLELLLIAIAMAAGGGADAPSDSAAVPGLQAEEQVASGKFTTALEVRPILTATRGNWVALRDFNGQDLLYMTHLLAWRCGLVRLEYSVNDGPLTDWPLPPCHSDTASPNTITPEDGLPYIAFAPGSVDSVQVRITYDDLTTDSASFERAAVMMP